MVCGRTERPETEAHIEAGLPHGAVPLVIIRAEFELPRFFASGLRHSRRHIANVQRICRTRNRLGRPRLRLDYIVVSLSRMKEKILCHLAIEAALILHR